MLTVKFVGAASTLKILIKSRILTPQWQKGAIYFSLSNIAALFHRVTELEDLLTELRELIPESDDDAP